MKEYISEKFWRGLAEYFYTEVIYPAAKKYVEKTDNSYDDSVLALVDGFVRDFLKDK